MATHLIIPDVGLVNVLNAMVAGNFNSSATSLNLDLYTDNITPSPDDILSTFSGSVPSFMGYSAGVIDTSDWSSPSVDARTGTITTANYTFTLTEDLGDPVICYGYFIHIAGGSSDGDLVWAQRFISPLVFINNGDNYAFPAIFQINSKYLT